MSMSSIAKRPSVCSPESSTVEVDMYEMREPADAATSRFSPRAQQLGIADQTVEHWFDPFGWAAPTGYLADKPDTETDEP